MRGRLGVSLRVLIVRGLFSGGAASTVFCKLHFEGFLQVRLSDANCMLFHLRVRN